MILAAFESGGLTISCTVLYPEQFDALRRTYDCEKSMIESLARCVKWDSSGGKSGSAFLKTQGARALMPAERALSCIIDDRFIAKGMSRTEVQTMETFAPAYFDYMSSAVSADVWAIPLFRKTSTDSFLSAQPCLRRSSVVIRLPTSATTTKIRSQDEPK